MPPAPPGTANIAVGIPTFNRPADCVNALRELTADPLVDQVIGAVIVPDQGERKVRDHPDFPPRLRDWVVGSPSTTSPTWAVPAATAG